MPRHEASDFPVRQSPAVRQRLLCSEGRWTVRVCAYASDVPDAGGRAVNSGSCGSARVRVSYHLGNTRRFWTPEYAKTFNVPGYHLHFISDDRKHGGHLLQCRGANLRLQIQREGNYHVALPETEDFLKADLCRDPVADLAEAEGEKK